MPSLVLAWRVSGHKRQGCLGRSRRDQARTSWSSQSSLARVCLQQTHRRVHTLTHMHRPLHKHMCVQYTHAHRHTRHTCRCLGVRTCNLTRAHTHAWACTGARAHTHTHTHARTGVQAGKSQDQAGQLSRPGRRPSGQSCRVRGRKGQRCPRSRLGRLLTGTPSWRNGLARGLEVGLGRPGCCSW